ncbi:hypothetical protein BU17DRAFT_71926 [Hysterangium stoloniferum]|nr:hypothetical protein BU17DRAFT_71926 [Hysterangium stoloniferum]
MFNMQQKCLEIIKARPRILHQLLSIIDSVTREKSDAGYSADALACQILVFFLNGPSMWILELGETDYLSSDYDFPPGKTKDNDEILLEWAAVKSIHKYFIHLQDWKYILLKKWNELQSETHEDIVKCSILRILVNLTYECELPTSLWFSFLTLAYEAAQKVPSEATVRRSKSLPSLAQIDVLIRRERMVTIERHPLCLSLVVASQYTLGPLLLLRIVHCIYKTYGTDITSWKTLPDNTLPHDHLQRVQQIASGEVLGPLMRNIILHRIPYVKKEGTRRFEQIFSSNSGLPEEFARSSYWFAAELAMAVKVFEQDAGSDKEEWAHLVPKAEKELVACFGNISLMSSKLGEYYLSWRYANLAVTACNKIDPAEAEWEGWNLSALKEKNIARRSDAATKLNAADNQ